MLPRPSEAELLGRPLLVELNGVRPEVSSDAWVAPGVVLTGAVRVAAQANLWFGVVARGDVEPITIGRACSIQDGVVLHTDDGHALEIGDQVAVGHGAVVHGATVGAGSLIGMRATVLSGARIGNGAVIAAGSVVLEHQEVPAGGLAVGVPARVVRTLDQPLGPAICGRYLQRAEEYRAGVVVL